jgi:hypothetical protein
MKKEQTATAAKVSHEFFFEKALPLLSQEEGQPADSISPVEGILGQMKRHSKAGNRAGFILAQLRLQRWTRKFPQSPSEGARLCVQLHQLETELLANASRRYYDASERFLREAGDLLQAKDLLASNEAMKKARKLISEAEAMQRTLTVKVTQEADLALELNSLPQYHS